MILLQTIMNNMSVSRVCVCVRVYGEVSGFTKRLQYFVSQTINVPKTRKCDISVIHSHIVAAYMEKGMF